MLGEPRTFSYEEFHGYARAWSDQVKEGNLSWERLLQAVADGTLKMSHRQVEACWDLAQAIIQVQLAITPDIQYKAMQPANGGPVFALRFEGHAITGVYPLGDVDKGKSLSALSYENSTLMLYMARLIRWVDA